MKKYLGPFLFVLLAVLPVVFWISTSSLEFRFLNLSTALTSFSQLTALVGSAAFALTFVLAGRIRWMEDYFGGLPNMYTFHHLYGAGAFVLLLIHPLLLIIRGLQTSVERALVYLIPGSNWTYNYGIISLFVMSVLLILTFYVKLPYDLWKKTHKFIGLALFFGALHALFIPSDISRNVFLKYYLFLLIFVGGVAFVYRSVLGKYLVKRVEYEVVEVNKLKKDVVEVVMSPKKESLDFVQGQFIFVNFESMPEQHPFSISSSPYEKNLRITIKALGDYTSRMGALKVGEMAYIEGPFGRLFYHNLKHKNQVWIAGGVGITPFISMIRSLKEEPDREDYKIDLYYCNKKEEDNLFVDEILEVSKKVRGFRFVPWCTRDRGRIDGRALKYLSKGLHNKDFILCCPGGMNKSLKEQLISLGVQGSRIHFEQFSL